MNAVVPPNPKATSRPGWLFGPLPDLLLGCGGGYLLVLLVLSSAGDAIPQPIGLLAMVTLVISAPHYGATLLRVYEKGVDRRAHTTVALWATLAIALFFVAGVYHPLIAAWMFTVYSTWSPWHYTGQNYGVCLMMLGRRGVGITPLAKRLLYLSFVGSFLITFVVLHGSIQASGYIPNPTDYNSQRVSFVSLGIPGGAASWLLTFATLLHAGALLGAVVALYRRASWSALAPGLAVVVTQIAWFSLPFSLRFWQIETGIATLDEGLTSHFVVWTATGHALQYLWVTSYFARSQTRFDSFPRYFVKVLCAGTAIWALPGLIFASAHLGSIESADGLLLLISAAVNLHHFVLDGAIWKLRSRRVGNVLLRATPDQEDVPAAAAASNPWLRRGVWGVCTAGAGLAFTTAWLEHGVFMPSIGAGEAPRARAALDWIALAGREFPELRLALGEVYRRRGELDAATEQYAHSLALRPTTEALRGLLEVQASREEWSGVRSNWEAYRERAAFDPVLAGFATQAYYALGQQQEARALLDQVLAMTEGSAGDLSRFGDLAQGQGDLDVAVRYYRAALDRDPERYAAANNLAWILATANDDSLRDGAEAVLLAEQVVAAAEAPDPNLLDTLAAALASAGRYEEAYASARRALELAEARELDALAEQLRERMALYREGRAFRQDRLERSMGSREDPSGRRPGAPPGPRAAERRDESWEDDPRRSPGAPPRRRAAVGRDGS